VAFDGNGNMATLVNAADATLAAQYEYGPFGEVIRASGPLARANPARFSSKFQDDESDLVYYGYRYYDSSAGRWVNRDPAAERGGLNCYSFTGNSPGSYVDLLGLCKVCGKGRGRWRVSIDALDSEVVGTPHRDLANWFIDDVFNRSYLGYGITSQPLTKAEPFVGWNSEQATFSGEVVPPNTLFASHYPFFVEFDIDESDGPCSLGVLEAGHRDIVFSDGNIRKGPTELRYTEPNQTVRKAELKKPAGCCGTRLIYIDAPGSFGFKGTDSQFGFGFSLATSIFVHVLDASDVSVANPYHVDVQLNVDFSGKILLAKP